MGEGRGPHPWLLPAAGGGVGVCEGMSGGVQQWTATLWGTQPAQPQYSYRDRPDGGPTITDPADLPAQARMVYRGGPSRSERGELRSSARGNFAPISKPAGRGFRVVMEIPVQA